jgi:hypothetical protein
MLADTTRSGKLYFPEFALAMYLCNLKLLGKPLPLSLPENIKREISKMVEWIISCGPIDARRSDSGAKPPDFNILQGLESTSASQKAYPGPSNAFPVQKNDFQGGFGSPLSQNSTMQPAKSTSAVNGPQQPGFKDLPKLADQQFCPRDPYVHLSPPLSQPYASTVSQDDGGSSQPQKRPSFSQILAVSGNRSRHMYVYTN